MGNKLDTCADLCVFWPLEVRLDILSTGKYFFAAFGTNDTHAEGQIDYKAVL